MQRLPERISEVREFIDIRQDALLNAYRAIYALDNLTSGSIEELSSILTDLSVDRLVSDYESYQHSVDTSLYYFTRSLSALSFSSCKPILGEDDYV